MGIYFSKKTHSKSIIHDDDEKLNYNFIHPKSNYITRFKDSTLRIEYPEMIFSSMTNTLNEYNNNKSIIKRPLAHLIFDTNAKKVLIRVYRYIDISYECKLQIYIITYDQMKQHFDILIDTFLLTYDFELETNYNFFYDKVLFSQNYYDSISLQIARQLLDLALTYDSKITYPVHVIVDCVGLEAYNFKRKAIKTNNSKNENNLPSLSPEDDDNNE